MERSNLENNVTELVRKLEIEIITVGEGIIIIEDIPMLSGEKDIN